MIVKVLSAVSVMALLVGGTVLLNARNQQNSGTSTHRTPQTLAEFEELFAEVSNWGRWGDDDELGTLNLITDAKRRAGRGTGRARDLRLAFPRSHHGGGPRHAQSV